MQHPNDQQALETARALGRKRAHGRDLDGDAALALFRACVGREDQPDDGDLGDELCVAYEEGALERGGA